MLGSGAFEATNEGYAIAKFAGIKLCQAISIEKRVNFSSLIPCNLYGPFDNFNLETAHVIPALIRKFVAAREKKQRKLEIMGNGHARREFLYSEDLARAIWFFSMKELRGGIVNTGAGSEISIRDLTALIAKIVGFKGEISFTNQGLNGVESKLMNSERAFSMGWKPSITLEEGLARTVAWFEENSIELSR
jgi:GDP-L-fucose synthase